MSGLFEMNAADDRGLHMASDECGLFEIEVSDDSELHMDGDECGLFEKEVSDDTGLHMDSLSVDLVKSLAFVSQHNRRDCFAIASGTVCR
jgi:hypothetical protein